MNRRFVLLLLSCLILIILLVFLIIKAGPPFQNYTVKSEVPGITLQVKNAESFNKLANTFSIFTEGAYNREQNKYEEINQINVIFTSEKQDSWKNYAGDESDENLVSSGSYKVNNGNLDVSIFLNYTIIDKEVDKNFQLNLIFTQMLLAASNKQASRNTYSVDDAVKITSEYFTSDEDASKYPLTIKKD